MHQTGAVALADFGDLTQVISDGICRLCQESRQNGLAMSPISRLYDYADQSGIPIYDFSLSETGSVSVMDEDGSCCIGIDQSILDGDVLERVHLGHELGHCVTGSFYNRYSAFDIRQRHENRADKWAILQLVTEDAPDEAVADGCCEILGTG